MLRIPHLKAILVNIFGGIMKCDVIAAGVVAAAKQVSLRVPLVVRLEGTNVDLGKKILADSGLPIISANNMADAGRKVVAAAGGGKVKTKPKKAKTKPKTKIKVKAKVKAKKKVKAKAKGKAKKKSKAKKKGRR
jgi:hypothetical protein